MSLSFENENKTPPPNKKKKVIFDLFISRANRLVACKFGSGTIGNGSPFIYLNHEENVCIRHRVSSERHLLLHHWRPSGAQHNIQNKAKEMRRSRNRWLENCMRFYWMPSLRWCGQSFTFSVPTCATTNTAHPSSLMTRTKWLPVFCSLLGRYRFPFLSFRMSTYFQINCCCPHRQQRVTMNHQTGCSFLSLSSPLL